jgi:hypothetical protein
VGLAFAQLLLRVARQGGDAPGGLKALFGDAALLGQELAAELGMRPR